MERDYGGTTSPPLSDGETHGSTAPQLSALFAMEQQKLQSGNSSFRYHPPKLPATQSTVARGVIPVTGCTSNMLGPSEVSNSAPSLQVLHSVAVLQLLISNSSGSKNFVGNAGMAILETSSSQSKGYQLVLYDASKRTLTSTPISRDFQCTPKVDCWVNFTAVNQSWSALFNSTEDWEDFARAVVLARSVVARVSNSFSGVIIQDVSPQQDVLQTGLREGDMVQVTYKAWVERSGFPGTRGHCFQETAGKGKKLELGSGKAIKGLEQGVIGMTKNSRRLLVVPPDLAYGSSLELSDQIPDDAILFFDVTVSRTRRHKGPASEASHGGKELLSDQLSYNGDAGSEREELIASTLPSITVHDEVKLVNASTVAKDDPLESVQGDKHRSDEKKELLIDRMAKLSRIGGAGSYNLPTPSSVLPHQKRVTVETPQPRSPSSDAATPINFTVEAPRSSSDGFDHSSNPLHQESVRIVDRGTSATMSPKSTSLRAVPVEDNVDEVFQPTEEEESSDLGNNLLERSDGDSETQVVSTAPVFHRVDQQQPKLGDGVVADVPPLRVSEHPGNVEDLLNLSSISSSCCEPGSTRASYPSSSSEASGPQSTQTTTISSPPSYTPFSFHTAAGTPPSSSTEAPPPHSVIMNTPAPFQPMGSLSFAPVVLPGQANQPYLGHPALVPWFPWGFPQYAPPPAVTIPAAESKQENQQMKILQNIQQTQASFVESLRNLTLKVEALTEVCNKRSDQHENEQSEGQRWLGTEGKRADLREQVSSEDDDIQVDSLVESVALMLAENRELRRRLSEYKNQSPAAMGPSLEQSSYRLMASMEEDKWSEDPEFSSRIPQLNLPLKIKSDLEFEPTTLSPRGFSKTEAELTVLENEMKLAMNQVYREVAEELKQSEDFDRSLPVVHEKLMEGVDAMIRVLREKPRPTDPEKESTRLRSPKPKDVQAGNKEGVSNPTDVGIETGGGGELDILQREDLSLLGLERTDDCSRAADHEEFKLLPESSKENVKLYWDD